MATSSIYSRISGISSGLDTDAIVKSLLTREQTRIDKVFRQKTRLEWTMTARDDIAKAISSFRSNTLSALSTSNLFSTAAFNTFKANLETTTNSVSLATTTDASVGTTVIDSISRIAEGASAESAATLTGGASLDRGTTLGELSLTTPLVFGGDNSDELAFSINGQSFTFKKTDTLRTMMSTINASSAGVNIGYSELSDKLTITSKTTGAESAITIVNTTGNAFGAGSAFGIADGEIKNGQDALLSINGHAVTRSVNNFTIDGINYTLKNTSATPITFSTERNVDSTIDKVKNFVTQYNTLVEKLQSTIREEADSDYYPLTDTEKEAMSEDEITAWEKKAKAGILYNDRNINNLLNTLRKALYATVEGTGLSAASVGLKTGLYTDGGKITLDEDTLRTALTNNPDQVSQVFTQSSTGFLSQVSTALTSYTKTYSISASKEEISRLATRITSLEERLADQEDFLYEKYTSMEQTLAKLNQQSGYLASLNFN